MRALAKSKRLCGGELERSLCLKKQKNERKSHDRVSSREGLNIRKRKKKSKLASTQKWYLLGLFGLKSNAYS